MDDIVSGNFASSDSSLTMGNTCTGVRQRMPWVHNQREDDVAVAPGSPYTRIIRHYSVESEVPDNTISNLFPLEDNYISIGSGSKISYRSPKSLSQLCVEQVCRSLPMLDGELPPGLPQDIVDKIVHCLISHHALNGTTLRALRFCEVGTLSLANCRGVTDAWLRSLNQRSLGNLPLTKSEPIHSDNINEKNEYSIASDDSPAGESQSSSCQDYDFKAKTEPSFSGGDASSSSTSFASAMSNPFPSKSPLPHEKESNYEDYSGYINVPIPQPSSITSTLTTLDLSGSQRLTDRGLLQLHSLHLLEVAKLDHCHSLKGKGLIAFASSHSLHTLSLANCRRLSDEGIINVSHLQSISALSLDGCRSITDQAMEAISNLINLRKLDLSQCDLISNEGIQFLHAITLLEELSLGWCRLISDEGIKELVTQVDTRGQCLKILRLARCPITDAGMLYLRKLVSLEELDLNGCSEIGSSALGTVLERMTRLTSLDVSYCPSILNKHSWQGKIEVLQNLDLCYSGVKDSHLSRFSYLPALEELNLDSCEISDWAIAHLADNNVTPNLTALDLADTDITDSALVHIAKFHKLKKLSLFYCHISNTGLRYIAALSSLEELNLDSRDVSDQGLFYLANLSKLKALDIFSGRITDHGCVHLSKILSLESLELCGGGIGDRGCAYLASLENLTSLNLSQNERITNRGAAALASLGKLKALNLSNTRVTSVALRYFSSLVHLQSLALYGCNGVNNESIDSFQNELPSLKCLRLQHDKLSNINNLISENFFDQDEDSDDTRMLLFMARNAHRDDDSEVGSSNESDENEEVEMQDIDSQSSLDTRQDGNDSDFE